MSTQGDDGDIESQQQRTRAGQTPSNKGPISTLMEIGVNGMTCSMCSIAVTRALQDLEGVQTVTVSLATDSAKIAYDATKVSPDSIRTTIEDIGYEAVPLQTNTPFHSSLSEMMKTVDLSVQGMTCSMCTHSIQQALEAVPGVESVVVSLATNTAHVQFLSANGPSVEVLRETIEGVGYEVTDATEVGTEAEVMRPDRLERLLEQQQQQVVSRKRAFLWSLMGTCPIVFCTMVLPHLPSNSLDGLLNKEIRIGGTPIVLEAFILWLLCTPIQFGCGWEFYKGSYYNLRTGVMGMDVLVALGTSASYGYAVWATLTGTMEYHFFETSAVLICFVLLGKWMQRLAVRRTSLALTQLLALQPKTAIKVAPLGTKATAASSLWNPLIDSYQEMIVPLEFIQKGDLVKILKGSSIPADGIVTFGEMSVDESMITGESVPVLKTQGSIVLGGTVCVEAGQATGSAFVEVTGVGSSTALSQIVKLVSEAQSRQVPIQNLADTVASFFVPAVVTISVLTYMVWYGGIQSGVIPKTYLPNDESPATFSLLFGIACLVISCPCALGLATPTAIMVGTAVGAKNGILFKGGETLELASKVDAIIFDKTGTLTQGKPAVNEFTIVVTEVKFWNDVLQESEDKNQGTKRHLLWLLGSLERNSEHPLATAVVTYAEATLKNEIPYVQPKNFRASTGRGASGTVGKTQVAVGNRAFCELNSIRVDNNTEEKMREIERQGSTAIIVAINGVIVAVMGVSDELKPDAASAIRYLREEMKVDVWMVTGDNHRTARAVARKLNFPMDRVLAEALPVAKVQKVQELQQRGYVVAMVGDGVNDSPALAQSDVGLSLGTGAEIAAEASDMVLVKGNVSDVCTALDLSQVIFRRIKVCMRHRFETSRKIYVRHDQPCDFFYLLVVEAEFGLVSIVQWFEYPNRRRCLLPTVANTPSSYSSCYCHGYVIN